MSSLWRIAGNVLPFLSQEMQCLFQSLSILSIHYVLGIYIKWIPVTGNSVFVSVTFHSFYSLHAGYTTGNIPWYTRKKIIITGVLRTFSARMVVKSEKYLTYMKWMMN